MNHTLSTVNVSDLHADEELLKLYLAEGDQGAFTQLVEKHAALVLGICKRILRDQQEAEDCFQQVFLKLARKGETIRHRDSIVSWLFVVAHREAVRRAQQCSRMPLITLEEEPMPLASEQESRPEAIESAVALQEEVSRLPDTYRGPIVLCYLQGKSREETARELKATDASIKARLARGRELLRKRLVKRGIVYGTAITAWQSTSSLSAATVSSTLIAQTVAVSATQATTVSTGLAGSTSLSSFKSGALKLMALSNSSKIGISVGIVVLTLLGLSTVLFLGDSPDSKKSETNSVSMRKAEPTTDSTIPAQTVSSSTAAPIDFDQLEPFHAAAARFIDAIERQEYEQAMNMMDYPLVTKDDRYWEKKSFRDSYAESLARIQSALADRPLRFTLAYVDHDSALIIAEPRKISFGNQTVENAQFEVPCSTNDSGEWRVNGIHMTAPEVPSSDYNGVEQFLKLHPAWKMVDLQPSDPPGDKIE
ncbi:MAG: sigma-70 family RNA polymerase sigma factor [Planctomycetaceae bacterium]